MVTHRPIGADERIAEHKRRLRGDPQYLEDFLRETEVSKETAMIIEELHAVYAMHGLEDALPEKEDLIRIIDRAHADTQASVRENVSGIFGFIPSRPSDPSTRERGYERLRDLSSQYLHTKQMMDTPNLSEEEAMEMVQSESRLFGYQMLILGSIEALKESKGILDIAKSAAVVTLGLLPATWYAIAPTKHRAKTLMKGHLYETTPEGRKHFERIKADLDDIFGYYIK